MMPPLSIRHKVCGENCLLRPIPAGGRSCANACAMLLSPRRRYGAKPAHWPTRTSRPVDDLHSGVRGRAMARGDDRPHTIHDVAKLAGVSASSVSRTLNGHPNVSARLRQRVEAAVRELEFHPNPAAQTVRGGRTGLIGFLIDSMTNGPIYASVDQVLRSHGYSML